MTRPKVAVIASVYFAGSHADVVATRLIEGYPWESEHIQSRVEVVSMYLEQLGSGDDEPVSRADIGLELARRNGVPRFGTVGEAIACGGSGVHVDGVVIIGEHGNYELNEVGQKLYPRRRLFDAAVAATVAGGRTIPIFNDKHLATATSDAVSMVSDAHRLGIPMLAGSTVPLTWRIPTATQWPLDAPMTDAVLVGFGPTEMYGFHNLEALQVHAERRAGGETGVVAVQAISGDDARRAVADGTVDPELFERAVAAFNLDPEAHERAAHSAREVFFIEYADGLRATVVNCNEVIDNFAIACRGAQNEMACQMFLEPAPHRHFIFMVRQIETMVLEGRAPYPIERTLLTTGMLDTAMHSLHAGGVRLPTPLLDISYRAVDEIPATGVLLPKPATIPPGELT